MLEVEGGLFKTYWTEDILAEALYHLRRDHPTWDGGRVADIRQKITATVEGGRVDDFSIDGSSPWKDPHDQHVHAAAVACAAGYLLTADTGLRDPDVDPDSLPCEVYGPDEFLELIDNSAPHVVRAVAAQQEAHNVRKHGEADICQALRRANCPRFADRVRNHLR